MSNEKLVRKQLTGLENFFFFKERERGSDVYLTEKLKDKQNGDILPASLCTAGRLSLASPHSRNAERRLNVNIYTSACTSLNKQPNQPSQRIKTQPLDLNALHPQAHTYLLQLVGLRFVFVPVCVLPVGQTERPHGHDAVNIVTDPGVRLIWACWEKACDRILWDTGRSQRSQAL